MQEERRDVRVFTDNQFNPLVDDPGDERHLPGKPVQLRDQQLGASLTQPLDPSRLDVESVPVSFL